MEGHASAATWWVCLLSVKTYLPTLSSRTRWRRPWRLASQSAVARPSGCSPSAITHCPCSSAACIAAAVFVTTLPMCFACTMPQVVVMSDLSHDASSPDTSLRLLRCCALSDCSRSTCVNCRRAVDTAANGYASAGTATTSCPPSMSDSRWKLARSTGSGRKSIATSWYLRDHHAAIWHAWLHTLAIPVRKDGVQHSSRFVRMHMP